MNKKRIFTDKELKDMGTRTLDLVLEAIEAGDKAKAKELAQRMYKEFNFLHDGFMLWVTGLQSYIYKNYGIEAVEKAEREAHTIEGKIAFLPSEKPECEVICNRSWSKRTMKSSALPCSPAVPGPESFKRAVTRPDWPESRSLMPSPSV
jgi:hypothetical protein